MILSMNHFIMLASFFGFTGLVAVFTWLLSRRHELKSEDGYFLAGRSLTFPFIAGSLLLTNLSTEQMVGLNGTAFLDGLCVMAWEVVAVIALVLMALFFLPRFLAKGIATVPQYLELRFDRTTGTFTNLIFLLAYAFQLLPIILYTGATGLNSILDIAKLTGIQNPTINLYLMVFLVGLVGSIYALFGGLRSVAVSDTLNGIGLLIGGFLIVIFGLLYIGDGALFGGLTKLVNFMPEKFNSIGPSQSTVPFPTLFSGILLINVFYWCTNQQIIQRTFGASSLAEGQKGVLLTGFLKLFGPLYLVLPGIMALYIFRDAGIKGDHAYGMLVSKVLPTYLTGFFAAVLVGAILSSFSSALNATCTLFSLGIYKPLINPGASQQQVVRSGKTVGWIIAAVSMLVAPLLASTTAIFDYLQKINGIYFIPIFSVVLMGMLTKKVPSVSAKIALVLGCVTIILGYFVPPFSRITNVMHEYHFLGVVFLGLILMMWIFGLLAPKQTSQPESNVVQKVDLTPWKYAPHCGAALVIIVIAIYAFFADFSVLKSGHASQSQVSAAVTEVAVPEE